MSTTEDAATWPRDGIHRSLDGVSWFAPSRSQSGAYRLVQWWTHPNEGIWFTCSCPRGQAAERMGSRYERPCRHVLAVTKAEAAEDMIRRRPTPPPNISALTD